MIRKLFSSAYFGWLVISAFIFGTIFPTIRAFIIGSEGSKSFFDFSVSAVPDLITVVLLVLALIIRKKELGSYFFPLQKPDYIILFILAYSLIIGSLISGDLKLIIYSIRMTYLPMSFYFIARIFSELWDESYLIKIVKNFMFWLGISAFIGLLLYFAFDNLEEKLKDLVHANKGEYYIERLNSIYHAPTLNGAYMAAAALFFILLWHYNIQLNYLIYLFLITASLLLSVSRGGIIGFIASAGIGVLWIRKWKSTALVGLLILGSVWITSLSVGLSLNNLGWIFKSTANTATMQKDVTRVGLWESAYGNILDKPFGYGLGKSGWIAYRFLKDSDVNSSYTSTDGWYLKQANETGVIGLGSFILFFIVYLLRVIPFVKTKSFDLLLYIVLFTIQVLLICIVSNALDYFIFNAVFWFLIGIGENIISRRKKLKTIESINNDKTGS